MKHQHQHTPGPWKSDGHDGKESQIVHSTWGAVARIVFNGDCTQQDANARLIAEAGTVTTECGLTPRQLLGQRNELLEACETLLGCYEMDATMQASELRRIKATIAKATGKE